MITRKKNMSVLTALLLFYFTAALAAATIVVVILAGFVGLLVTAALCLFGLYTLVWFIILAMIIFSIGEMLASPKSKEYAGRIAPPRTNADTASTLLGCLYTADYVRARDRADSADARLLDERAAGRVLRSIQVLPAALALEGVGLRRHAPGRSHTQIPG